MPNYKGKPEDSAHEVTLRSKADKSKDADRNSRPSSTDTNASSSSRSSRPDSRTSRASSEGYGSSSEGNDCEHSETPAPTRVVSQLRCIAESAEIQQDAQVIPTTADEEQRSSVEFSEDPGSSCPLTEPQSAPSTVCEECQCRHACSSSSSSEEREGVAVTPAVQEEIDEEATERKYVQGDIRPFSRADIKRWLDGLGTY